MTSKQLFATAFAVTAMFAQSCNKSDDVAAVARQTVAAIVAQNGTYTYTLPSGTSNYRITSQSAHYTTSRVSSSNGAAVYQYTPATDYVGTDAVVITSEASSAHAGCNGGSGGQAQQEITINIAVTADNTNSAD